MDDIKLISESLDLGLQQVPGRNYFSADPARINAVYGEFTRMMNLIGFFAEDNDPGQNIYFNIEKKVEIKAGDLAAAGIATSPEGMLDYVVGILCSQGADVSATDTFDSHIEASAVLFERYNAREISYSELGIALAGGKSLIVAGSGSLKDLEIACFDIVDLSGLAMLDAYSKSVSGILARQGISIEIPLGCKFSYTGYHARFTPGAALDNLYAAITQGAVDETAFGEVRKIAFPLREQYASTVQKRLIEALHG